jgi:ankyrin repeat protein
LNLATLDGLMTTAANDDPTFTDAIEGLHRGDFSRLEPLFDERSGRSGKPRIIEWLDDGRFRDQPEALAEALTCASFLGRTTVVECLLQQGVNASGGAGTGLNALHWAANRGQLEAVRLLIRAKAPLETRNMYGGTALGTTIWAAVNEPQRDHPQIIEELLAAGADIDDSDYPTGHQSIDAILQRHRSR